MIQTLVGDLKEFNLNDILQLLGMARQTGALKISRGAANKGIIYLADGDPVHASTSNCVGERAIYEMFTWREGKFHFNNDTTTECTIKTSLQNIVMESARRIDEWERVHDLIPSKDVVIEFNPAPQLGSENISLISREWRILSLVNGTRTIGDITAISDFDEFETCKILYGLLSSGLLKKVGDSKDKAKSKSSTIEKDKSDNLSILEDKKTAAQKTSPVKGQTQSPGVTFLDRLLGASKQRKQDEDYQPQNATGVVAVFINELLRDYETPQGLYSSIRLRDSLWKMVQEIIERVPITAFISVEENRLNVSQLDLDFPGEKPETYEVHQFLKCLIEWIYEDARKSLSPRSATRRYQDVFSKVFSGNHTLEKLGLENIVDRKRIS